MLLLLLYSWRERNLLLENGFYLKMIIFLTSSLSQLIHELINIVSAAHLPELMSLEFTLYLFILKLLSLYTSRTGLFYDSTWRFFCFNSNCSSNFFFWFFYRSFKDMNFLWNIFFVMLFMIIIMFFLVVIMYLIKVMILMVVVMILMVVVMVMIMVVIIFIRASFMFFII